MHPHINALYTLSNKYERLIIGLMSGTSLDGLDVALCQVSGYGSNTTITLLEFETMPYSQVYRDNVKHIFSKPVGDIEHLCIMNAWIGREHGRLVNCCLALWGLQASNIDLIASHGQTIYHCPADMHKKPDLPNATLQIGDADHIAMITGIITVSDFRQKHLAAGGQGAPLVTYGDHLMFSSANENRIMLNIGGITNFTYLPRSDNPSPIFSSDIGPGNTLMDAFVSANYNGLTYDRDSALASKGNVNANLLSILKSHPFFKQTFPKTTGPELFNLAYLDVSLKQAKCCNLGQEDILATLNQFSADTIFNAIEDCVDNLADVTVYVSGGGLHNPLLMKNLRKKSADLIIQSTRQLDIDPDAKEAILFALLANECVAAKQQTFQTKSANIPGITMGKISFPD
ncbi:Anhydro-N-acetylmuramic acid kinase [Alteromonas sp. 38]|uniref:anhydro-N-acetylmuramic acid kinase n=1 Tax=unclassified Alteromonas TaxID=2614992 RepID=UPI0012F22DF0|nr:MULTISPECIES: anhydro-N-acetylmuramic acid kinase [unclassified Alteromonas]CAD5285013.1 Anhydro-N-acetylmuramic acid kinase [Alteromonas sp. 154]VXB39878.1 Anhydro-N-acetylmuramic acid kinase [Alteromonas sp. 38]